MKTATVYALRTGRHLAKLGCEAVYLKSKWTTAAKEARRTARKTRHHAEDFLDEAAVRIKRRPLKSIGITFGAGLGIGTLAGWFRTHH